MEQKSFLYNNRWLLGGGGILFFTLSWLFYCYAPLEGHFEVDSHAYDRVARIFLETGTVKDTAGVPPIHTQGYHFFLGILYWLFGADNVGMVIAVQILLAFLSLLLTVRTAFLVGGSVCAQIVYALGVLDGAFLIYPQFILAETLLLFLIALFFERMVVFYRKRKNTALVQAGLVLGFSLIVKPTALFLPICFATCFAILSLFYSHGLRWTQLFIFCSALYAPVVVYIIRNGLVFGVYTFSSLTESGLFLYFSASMLSKLHAMPLDASVAAVQALADRKYTSSEFGYWKLMRSLFFTLLWEHPLVVIQIGMQNLLKTFFGLFSVQLQLLFDPTIQGKVLPFFSTNGSLFTKVWSYAQWAFRSPLIGVCMVLEFFLNGIRWALVVVGIQKLWSEKSYELLTFFFCIVGCFSIVTGFFGAGRYRITFEPILLILAAQGIESLYKIYKRIKLGASKKAAGL